jgi:hypothetical protein
MSHYKSVCNVRIKLEHIGYFSFLRKNLNNKVDEHARLYYYSFFSFLVPFSLSNKYKYECLYTKCMYVHKMYVCTQNVCMYTKCLYVHKYVCTQNYPILNRRATDCSCQTFSQCLCTIEILDLEQVCCKGLANILRERTL